MSEIADDYDILKRLWTPLQLVRGTVYATKRYGVFVDIGVRVPGLLEYIDGGDYDLEEPIGLEIEAVVAGFMKSIPEVKLSARPEDMVRSSGFVEIPPQLAGRPSLFRPSD